MSNHRIRVNRSKLPRRGDWYTLWPVWALCAVPILMLTFAAIREYRASLPQKSDVPLVALRDGQDLHIDAGKLNSGQLNLFEASASGQKVKFIVERTQNKSVHVALASCRACYHSHNPHYARKGEMICGKCNESMAFESKGQKAGTNNCTLPEIPHTETDRDVVVLARDVLAQAVKRPSVMAAWIAYHRREHSKSN